MISGIDKPWWDSWARLSDFEVETTFEISHALSRMLEQTSSVPFQSQITCYSVTMLVSSALQPIACLNAPCQNISLSLLELTLTVRKWIRKGGWKASATQRAKPALECHSCSIKPVWVFQCSFPSTLRRCKLVLLPRRELTLCCSYPHFTWRSRQYK